MRRRKVKQTRKNSFVKKGYFVLIFLLLVCTVNLWARVVNKTLATVNGELILLDEFQKKAELFIEQYQKLLEGPEGKEKIKEIKKEILNQMIDEKLMLQEARRKKIKISKRKIEEGMNSIKDRFPSEEEFEKELKRQNLKLSEFKEKIETQLMIMELIDEEVRSKVSIPTDAEIKTFYEENKDKMVEPAGVRVRHILIRVDEDADKETKAKALKKMKEIEKQLKKGANFSELARKYSEDPASSKRGGDLGFFVRGEMVPEFEEASFSLNVGKMSNIVETKFGYHIIKCEEKRAKQKKILEEVKDTLKNLIFQQHMEKKYEAWIGKLRDKADIKISGNVE